MRKWRLCRLRLLLTTLEATSLELALNSRSEWVHNHFLQHARNHLLPPFPRFSILAHKTHFCVSLETWLCLNHVSMFFFSIGKTLRRKSLKNSMLSIRLEFAQRVPWSNTTLFYYLVHSVQDKDWCQWRVLKSHKSSAELYTETFNKHH